MFSALQSQWTEVKTEKIVILTEGIRNGGKGLQFSFPSLLVSLVIGLTSLTAGTVVATT